MYCNGKSSKLRLWQLMWAVSIRIFVQVYPPLRQLTTPGKIEIGLLSSSLRNRSWLGNRGYLQRVKVLISAQFDNRAMIGSKGNSIVILTDRVPHLECLSQCGMRRLVASPAGHLRANLPYQGDPPFPEVLQHTRAGRAICDAPLPQAPP